MQDESVRPAFKFITYSIVERKKYAIISINRPEVMNALNLETRHEILTALDLAEEDDSVRVLVLTGAGEKAFSAGADIKIFEKMTPFTAREYLKTSKGTSSRLENFLKPVIAALNGHALGGGLELAMSCDIVVATSNAKFGLPEAKVGIIPGVGGTQRLPRRIGIHRAKELIFTGDLIDSEEALRIGLVNRVFPDVREMMAHVEELVEKISAKSPFILKLAKESVNRSVAGLREGLDFESALFEICFASKDQKEGSRAFLEKRNPAFSGS